MAYLLPAPREAHHWCVSLKVSPATISELGAMLTPDERNRSARFRFERDRQRFIVARGVLRELLGHYLEIDPAQIRFGYNAFGKPELRPEFGGRLRFNLSHSGDLALIAVATDADIGVDLESIGEHSYYAEIAQQFFSTAELDDLNRLPSHLHTLSFLSCWTRKEAYVKARGAGLAIDFTSFSVRDLEGRWSFHEIKPAPGYIGAVAIEGSGWQLSHRLWRPALMSPVPKTDMRGATQRVSS